MPVAAWIASAGHIGWPALAVSLACASAVLVYSLHKARRGDWTHVDASVPSERAQLTSRIGVGLLLAAGALGLAGLHVGIPLVVGLSGLIVALGHLFRHVAKLSLHVAFAVFAAFLVWPNHLAAVSFTLVAVGVAWSRIALRRHVAPDIVLGGLAGASAGLAFHGALAWLAA
jgi:hypothetical protein